MAQNSAREASSAMTGKPLVESDRVEGTDVFDPEGHKVGQIKRLMIDKLSGKVAYAVMTFGGFLGMGAQEHPIPWNKLTYDPQKGGFHTDITEEQLRGASSVAPDSESVWSSRERERRVHDYWSVPYYW